MRPLLVLVFVAFTVALNVFARNLDDDERFRRLDWLAGPPPTPWPAQTAVGAYDDYDIMNRQYQDSQKILKYNPYLAQLAQDIESGKNYLKTVEYESALYNELSALEAEEERAAPQYDEDSPVQYYELDSQLNEISLRRPQSAEQLPDATNAFDLSPGNEKYGEESDQPQVVAEGGLRLSIGPRFDEAAETPYLAESHFQDRRQLRQNPNGVKSLVSSELDSVRKAQTLSSLRSQIPVSLIPLNIQRLRSLQRAFSETLARAPAAAQTPALGPGGGVALAPIDNDTPAPLYAIAVFTALGAAISILVVGIAISWYTLSKRAKAAEDVDYPAYGVTGPRTDPVGGDCVLAKSAHMYHYQHQKHQIVSMDRCYICDERNGSISELESDEENEEGDYTVYECPGYATTGDIEVKNPMFSDEPTPATPAYELAVIVAAPANRAAAPANVAAAQANPAAAPANLATAAVARSAAAAIAAHASAPVAATAAAPAAAPAATPAAATADSAAVGRTAAAIMVEKSNHE